MDVNRGMEGSRIVDREEFDVAKEIEGFLDGNADGRSGGLLFFVGITKGESSDGKEVARLEIETYKELADRMLEDMAREVEERYKLQRALIIHSQGTFRPGESLVLVALAGRTRKEIFPAMEEAIRLYKTRPPIFKKEVYGDGTGRWIEGV